MLFGRQRRGPFEAQLLPMLDPTSDFDSLWGDTRITHPSGSAYLGLYKIELERIRNASDEISNLSSHISLIDDSLPRKMASVVSLQDDTNISFFEVGGLTLSPTSWFRSIRKKHRPRSAPQMQPGIERLYSPTFKYRFSNTTDTTWQVKETYNVSTGTIGSASGVFEPTMLVPSSSENSSLTLDRKQSPSPFSNEGLSSRSSQSPVSVDSVEHKSLPVNLVKTYRQLETVADKSRTQNIQIHDDFDLPDGKIIAVTPTCSVFTTEDEIVSDDDGSKRCGFASIDGAIGVPRFSPIQPESPAAKRSSSQRRGRKSLVINTSQSLPSLTIVKSPLLSSKSVRFDIPDSNDTSRIGDADKESVVPISFVPYGYVSHQKIESRADEIFRNPWLEPTTPMSARDANRMPSLPPTPSTSPPTPGILRQNGSRHPFLAVTGIMRAPLTSVNTPGEEHGRDTNQNRVQVPEVSSEIYTQQNSFSTFRGLPTKVAPPCTERSFTAPTLRTKHSFDPRAVSVNGRAAGPQRSKSLSDIPAYSCTACDGPHCHHGGEDHTKVGKFADGPPFI